MGDRRGAFEALFDEAFDRCCAVAARIVRDPAVAEELAAEAFARAWARWWWLGRQPAQIGWVVRVTTNLAIDVVRRRPPPITPAAAATSADDALALRDALAAALRALPERQRAAIALRYLADLSEPDVALAMGVSAGSVKTHLHRGLARLRASGLEASLAP